MIRIFLITFFFLFLSYSINAQTSLNEIDLEYGEYETGFRHYLTSDSTRTYHRIYDYTNKSIARPIPVSIWYPTVRINDNSNSMIVLDYFEILKQEEEWEYLPSEQLLNWFYYSNTPANQEHMSESTKAFHDVPFADGKFPVVVYAPSFQASSIENFALCEYLASHGFVVISSPSRGTENRWFSNNTAKEMETQARDVEFLIKEVSKFSAADMNHLALMGFSFGGLSNVIVHCRNANVKAIVSLDGTERYQYDLLAQSSFFDPRKIDVPYLHMAQKNIPEKVLEEDNIDPILNTKFELFDSLSRSSAYRLKFHNLTHSHFSVLGVLFGERDPRQDKSDPEIMSSYKLMASFVLNFLKATLKEDASTENFINKSIDDTIFSYSQKMPVSEPFTFQDFNDLAATNGYNNIQKTYESVFQEHPNFRPAEGSLNTLGLQLVFNPTTSSSGIDILLFATHLYPDSANLFDSLAEAYLFVGNKEAAIENFEKSLKLNPQNDNATNRLRQLAK